MSVGEIQKIIGHKLQPEDLLLYFLVYHKFCVHFFHILARNLRMYRRSTIPPIESSEVLRTESLLIAQSLTEVVGARLSDQVTFFIYFFMPFAWC